MKHLLFALIASMAVIAPPLAGAETYPSKPVRIVVPFSPGGPTDLLGRTIGQSLSDAWGQPVIVENKPGAAGNLGVDLAARAAPDGYTLVVVPAGNIAVNPTLFRDLPYKQSDLAPVTMLAEVENVLVVHPDVPVKTLKELLTLARQKPGALTFASPGAGSQAHLAGELLELNAGIHLIHVPYKGTGPALQDLIGGQVTMMFAQLSSALPHIRAGKLRPIGVASPTRSAVLPEVPTVAEQGMPKFEAVSWYALMAPAGTPAAVIDKISAEATKVLQRPENREKFAGLGMTAVGGKPAALAATIRTESERWADVIRKQKLTID